MDGRDLTSNEYAFPHSEPTPSAGDQTAEEALGSRSPAGGGDRTEEKAPDAPPPSVAVGENCDVLARAISLTLGAAMRELDLRASGAARSQDDLVFSLDCLTGELDKLLEDAPLLIIMQHATKITSIRKRVSSLNLLLKSIQRHIDNIDCMISTCVPTGGYDMEEKAARAYDLAALKYWEPSTHINFPLESYHNELEEMENMSRQEYVANLTRKSSGFSRGPCPRILQTRPMCLALA